MSNTWFTADTHYGHENIIKYCKRPFSDVKEMNEALIFNFNKKVAQEDTTYIVGDFCFTGKEQGESILNRLNGVKHLIVGNHDKIGRTLAGWASVKDYDEVSIHGQRIVLCHYAMRVWNKSHKGSWMLYGHSHGTLPDDPTSLSFDVGVDCHNFKPINMADIRRVMKNKTNKPIDHHGK